MQVPLASVASCQTFLSFQLAYLLVGITIALHLVQLTVFDVWLKNNNAQHELYHVSVFPESWQRSDNEQLSLHFSNRMPLILLLRLVRLRMKLFFLCAGLKHTLDKHYLLRAYYIRLTIRFISTIVADAVLDSPDVLVWCDCPRHCWNS